MKFPAQRQVQKVPEEEGEVEQSKHFFKGGGLFDTHPDSQSILLIKKH